MKSTKKTTTLFLVSFVFCLVFLVSSIATASEMPVTEDATCTSCHENYFSVTPSSTSFSPLFGGSHSIPDACLSCHGDTTTKPVNKKAKISYCTWCHYDNIPSGQTAYLSKGPHQTTGLSTFSNIVNVRHAVYESHISPSAACSECHSNDLTSLHVNKTDKNGDTITCNTCHTGNFLGQQIQTNNALKISKAGTPTYTTPAWSGIPTGTTISRVYIDIKLASTHTVEIYALYNGQWGLIYGPLNGITVKQWLDLPKSTTSLKTKIISSNSFFNTSLNWLNVPCVSLTPSASEVKPLKDAVANKDKNCEACHANSGHKHPVSKFSDQLGAEWCHTCHITEHAEDPTDVGILHSSKGVTCEQCHENPNYQSLFNNDGVINIPTCVTCHPDTEHKVHFVDKFSDTQENAVCQPCHITDTVNSSTDLVELHTKKGLTCRSCHDSPALQNILVKGGTIDIPTCAACHNEQVIQLYRRHYK